MQLQNGTVWGIMGCKNPVSEDEVGSTVWSTSNLDDMWFQQDELTRYTACEALTLLQIKIPDCAMYQMDDVDWPLSSFNLTPFYSKENV